MTFDQGDERAIGDGLPTAMAAWSELKKAHGDAQEAFAGLGFDRAITPDGHAVGSIGDCIASIAFGLEPEPGMSSASVDPRTADSRAVEIKTTQRDKGPTWAFRAPKDSLDRRSARRIAVNSDDFLQAPKVLTQPCNSQYPCSGPAVSHRSCSSAE
jgi:hypothetical protein